MAKALPRLKSKTIPGGEIVSRILALEGVETVFGIIDGTYHGFYTTLGKHGIGLVTPRHESSAAHAAGAYARLTGKLGVCMASNGPGVANILPGVAVEQAEGNRVLLITSSRRDGIVDPDRGGTYQYFPQVAVTGAMCKWSCTVPSPDRIAEIMRRALRISFEGRPGVVHVDIPESFLNSPIEPEDSWFREPEKYRITTPLTPTQAQIQEAAKLLRQAKRPLIQAGSGVIHALAYEELAEVAELLEAPVTTSWGGRAAIDERNRLAIPMHLVPVVNKARSEADLVLALGTRFGETEWWGKPPYWGHPDEQPTIHVDIDSDSLSNVRPAELAVRADVKVFLQLLAKALKEDSGDHAPRSRWTASLEKSCEKRLEQLSKHSKDPSIPMNSAQVPSACRELLSDDAVAILDGGNAAIWGNFYWQVRTPGMMLSTPKMGMLGAGVGQALGAQVAFPNRQVVCITGDGAMGFHPQEVETAIRNQLPIVFVILVDRAWGMVKINQSFMMKPLKTLALKSLPEDETVNTELAEIEWDVMARSMGAHGERVADPAGFKGALERSLASGKCSVIHVDVDRVKHLWAPELKTFKDMHQEPSGG